MAETDKRKRIIRAAEQLFHARQFHEITLDEVARRADVGKGTIYLYFSDKHDLFYQTAMAGFEEMCGVIRENASRRLSFREELARATRGVSDFFRLRRPIFHMIRAELKGPGAGVHRGAMLQRRRQLTQLLAAIIGRGKAVGEVRSALPLLVLAEYLLGMLRARALEMGGCAGPGTAGRGKGRGADPGVVEFFLHGAAGRHGATARHGTAAGARVTRRTRNAIGTRKK